MFLKESDPICLKLKKITEKLRVGGTMIRKGITSKTNKKRDIILIGIYLFTLVFFILTAKSKLFRDNQPENGSEMGAALSEEQIYQEVKAIQEILDMDNWKNYQSRWYGIEIRYPENWSVPKVQAASRGAKWEYKYQFRKKTGEDPGPFIGFDVVIYNLTKIKELADTAEFPALKSEDLGAEEECNSLVGHLIETGDYPAEEIYFPSSDICYDPALFFSFTKDQYIYNIVPVPKEGASMVNDPRVEIVDNFPEFFGAVSSLKITDIVRSRPMRTKPRIGAPKPFAETGGGGYGGMTCAKKNDHPTKSDQSKKKHLDMECCLDPDEYPNPWCNYDPAKYGKYLN